jgi:subtilisin family serine protease
VRFAGRTLRQHSVPVLYTENLFVAFRATLAPSAAKRLLARHSLRVKREVPWVSQGYFVAAPPGCGAEHVFAQAEELLGASEVELCHPEMVRERALRGAFAQQWHLQAARVDGRAVNAHAHVARAWALARGAGVTIAVIDDGVDLDHEEFALPGKIVAPRDISERTDDARGGSHDDHGTACAGVACAAGRKGASGVAPDARLMPIRLASDLGSIEEAEAIAWAVDQRADVIVCSWGPPDGDWGDPDDPRHKERVTLPDHTRSALEYAVTRGRGGRGCVVCWAAGNGAESVDYDGYASCHLVMAVAACNDRGRHSIYSDQGDAVFCCFPSNDFAAPGHPPPLTPGIWTTDRSGKLGYNLGGPRSREDFAGDYTGGFGGTSSAAPGVAGVAALALSANPDLTWTQVRDVIKRACERIDEQRGDYDRAGHSPRYGYGRVNAYKAVRLARRQ